MNEKHVFLLQNRRKIALKGELEIKLGNRVLVLSILEKSTYGIENLEITINAPANIWKLFLFFNLKVMI